jgi:hypothetical protein
MRTERDLEKYLKRECKRVGALYFKFSSPAHRGVPDCIVIAPHGEVTFIELKSPTGNGRLAPLQEHTIALMRDKGANVYVYDSKEQVDALIESFPIIR